jgi:Colicin V production protein
MVLIVCMTIWILALLLLAAGAGMGHRQGAVRVAVSFVGIIISALLAWPLSSLLRPLLPHVGIQNPFVVQLLAPVLVFIILMSLFKSLGLLAHHKVNVYYKYKADELQRIWWERLNRRLGLGLGLLNGLAYFILVSLIVYNFSYWTLQWTQQGVPPDGEKLLVRVLDRMGGDLQDTGLVRSARAIDPMPEIYFKTADLAGTIYQNPQLLDRLSAYPAFLSLAERDDFKQLGQNGDFQNAWKSHPPIGQLWDNPQVLSIRQNADIAGLVWNLVQTNLDDLQSYLQTGQSVKFASEKILGRWDFNVMASLTALVQTRANVPSSDMEAMRALWYPAYAKTVFVASADGQVFLKNLPRFKMQPNQPTTFDTATWQGQWKSEGNNYNVTLASSSANKFASATIDGSHLTLKTDGDTLIFERE